MIKYKHYFKHKRGAGYWVWKPEVLRLNLEKMEYGDILMFVDSGCELGNELPSLFETLSKKD